MDSSNFSYSVDSLDFESFTHKVSNSTITVPKDYSSHYQHNPGHSGYSRSNNGYYRAVVLTNKQQEDNGIRLLNAAFAGLNGNASDTAVSNADGYKYRGRGFVQVTGKSNYIEAKNTCQNVFQLQFNFEESPALMEADTCAMWASFAWFKKNISIELLNTKNPDLITYKVNSAGEQKGLRRNFYFEIKSSVLKCEN
jgi:predicted chitinase